MAFKMKSSPTKLMRKRTPGGAKLVKKKNRDSTVKDAINAAKNAPSESESDAQVTPSKTTKKKTNTNKYKKVPGFNS